MSKLTGLIHGLEERSGRHHVPPTASVTLSETPKLVQNVVHLFDRDVRERWVNSATTRHEEEVARSGMRLQPKPLICALTSIALPVGHML